MFKKILLYGGITLLALGVTVVGGTYWAYRSGVLQRLVADQLVKTIGDRTNILDAVATSTADRQEFVKHLLGFYEPRTYLFLFLNNTELRPGGGFIGSYATVELKNGVPHILKVEGTEILDYSGYPEDFPSVPPAPLKTYLGVNRWYFRDANWSPDFASSSEKALELYTKQRGVAAANIDGVIGITATVLEEMLGITGPIEVSGERFTKENVIEKLQYEVEQAFEDKGLSRRDRKQILAELVRAMSAKLTSTLITDWAAYLKLAERMFENRSIALYLTDAQEQAIVRAKQWAGEFRSSFQGDYLMWVDANLGALKTDAVIKRDLSYAIAPVGSGYTATITMRYAHQGGRDWKTSQYQSYTRLYLPLGTTLVKAVGIRKNSVGVATTTPEQGVEYGRQWFGGLIIIPPGSAGEVSFVVRLAPEVVSQIKRGSYYLLAQKELGMKVDALTLDMAFAKRVLAARPGEAPNEHGDNRYRQKFSLAGEQYVEINLEP